MCTVAGFAKPQKWRVELIKGTGQSHQPRRTANSMLRTARALQNNSIALLLCVTPFRWPECLTCSCGTCVFRQQLLSNEALKREDNAAGPHWAHSSESAIIHQNCVSAGVVLVLQASLTKILSTLRLIFNTGNFSLPDSFLWTQTSLQIYLTCCFAILLASLRSTNQSVIMQHYSV